MKERIEGELQQLEEDAFTYTQWVLDWQRREAARREREANQNGSEAAE